MTIDQMRTDISKVYESEKWRRKVALMHDSQVFAIYHRFLADGEFDKKKETKSKKTSKDDRPWTVGSVVSETFTQLTFDI